MHGDMECRCTDQYQRMRLRSSILLPPVRLLCYHGLCADRVSRVTHCDRVVYVSGFVEFSVWIFHLKSDAQNFSRPGLPFRRPPAIKSKISKQHYRCLRVPLLAQLSTELSTVQAVSMQVPRCEHVVNLALLRGPSTSVGCTCLVSM
jgi:hypothetical protein